MGNPTGIRWRSHGRWGWVAFVVVLILIFSPLCSPGGRGFKGRTWWDWLELAGVPVTLAGFGFWFQHQQRRRDADEKDQQHRRDAEERAEQRENAAVTEFIQSIQPLLLEKNLKDSPPDAEVRSVARALTLATLSQMESEEAPARKTLVIRFLLDSGLNSKPGNLFSLSDADLSRADLSGAHLVDADLSGANLSEANFYGANLIYANLIETDLKNVKWDEETQWPSPGSFMDAKNMPKDLSRQVFSRHDSGL